MARAPRLRGVRQQVHWHENPQYRFAPRPDVVADPHWRAGLAQLAPRGLLFELQVFASQMAGGAELARAFPQTVFVLEHAGMLEDLSESGLRTWRAGMRLLADCPNMHVKLSGLGTFVHRAALEDVQPICHADGGACSAPSAACGAPISRSRSCGRITLTLVDILRRAVSHLTPGEQRHILSETAARLYRLTL